MPKGIYHHDSTAKDYDKVSCDWKKHKKFLPQEHQKAVLDYFLNKLEHRGLLLFHKLGSGKSCSSILISDEMLKQSKVKKVYVLTPGSLRKNFIEEYCKKCGYNKEFLYKHYTFITTNFAVGDNLPNFNDSLVVIDEVHNLIGTVKNDKENKKHASMIYNALIRAKNCKILALSATPVFKDINEWPYLGHLLNEDQFTYIISGGEKKPGKDVESYKEKKLKLDKSGEYKIPDKDKQFRNSIRGIVSYFPGAGEKFYPKVIHHEPIQVRMTMLQDSVYWPLAEQENILRRMPQPNEQQEKEFPGITVSWIMAKKYQMSKTCSNFYYPTQFRLPNKLETVDEVKHNELVKFFKYKPTGEKFKSYQALFEKTRKTSTETDEEHQLRVRKNTVTVSEMKEIGWIEQKTIGDFKLTDVYSRKITALIINILSNWKSKHVVYTFYKTKAGVQIIQSLFKLCGIHTEVYSGDVQHSKRQEILNNFNKEENRYGDNIKALLFTDAGTEGINILEAGHIHILESNTKEMKIQQAIGRVVRYRSHMVENYKPMPKNRQVVNVWRYWSTSDDQPVNITIKKFRDGKIKTILMTLTDKKCVDQILYENGRVQLNHVYSFINLLKKESVVPLYNHKDEVDFLLPRFRLRPVSSSMTEAYNVSNNRYLKNLETDPMLQEFKKSSEDLNINKYSKDLVNVEDEDITI